MCGRLGLQSIFTELKADKMEQNGNVKIIKTAAAEDTHFVRIAAYCRVSTDSEEQEQSFFAQVQYYTEYIRSNKNMRLVDIYADQGKTGTSIYKRPEFLRMLKDAKNGRMDRILVKSVQRFARNSLECLEAIREFKACGVTIFFENDFIDTDKLNSEMLLYIKSAFAQAESISHSKRMSTSIRMRAEEGTYCPTSVPYGFRYEKGEFVPVPQKAEKVKTIYDLYLSGMGQSAITKYMYGHETDGTQWKIGRVQNILSNERYIGDYLFGKTYTPPVLPLKPRRNYGEVDMFYCENANEPIIEKDKFEAAKLMRERNNKHIEIGDEKFFKGKIYCQRCNWRYRYYNKSDGLYWGCSHKGTTIGYTCHSPVIKNDEFEMAFIGLFNRLKHNRQYILDDTISLLQTLKSKVMHGSDEMNKIDSDLQKYSALLSSYNRLHLQGVIDDLIYIEKTDSLTKKLTLLRSRRKKLSEEDESDNCIKELVELRGILDSHNGYIAEFDKGLFNSIVKRIDVRSDRVLVFSILGGLKLEMNLCRTE